MPFLTKLDPNAQIKGSRDPLGIQGIWTNLGRRIVSNLTTVSTSVSDFAATILGYAFVEQLENENSAVEIFLRWEQWAAYSRVHCHPGSVVRGVERVRARLNEESKVVISAARQHQILSNQKTYGLWGLYSMPSRECGLIEHRTPRLTDDAREFIEREYWPRLKPTAGMRAKKLAEALNRTQFKIDLEGGQQQLVSAIADLLAIPPHRQFTSGERNFYTKHLLNRTPLQQRAVETMPKELTFGGKAITPALLQSWSRGAELKDPDLAIRLHQVLVAESVLAPMACLFSRLLGCDGRPLRDVVADLHKEWGAAFTKLDLDTFADLRGAIREAAGKRQDSDIKWLDVAHAMHQADYKAVIRLLCEINASVMDHRGGARWISIENGKIKVHAFEAPRPLPSAKDLGDLWEHSYFLDSLATVTAPLQE
ncbi:MAG: hypothetical protein ABIS50_00530 [Luteolibacter sp.]|uniref:hypothetical protein n=1 Tax=Luteolibacter sp. TaxID=1962973 RepID=UPI00326643C8